MTDANVTNIADDALLSAQKNVARAYAVLLDRMERATDEQEVATVLGLLEELEPISTAVALAVAAHEQGITPEEVFENVQRRMWNEMREAAFKHYDHQERQVAAGLKAGGFRREKQFAANAKLLADMRAYLAKNPGVSLRSVAAALVGNGHDDRRKAINALYGRMRRLRPHV